MYDYYYLFTTEGVILTVRNECFILWDTEVALLCLIKKNCYGQAFSGVAYELDYE